MIRGPATRALWIALWACWLVFLVQQVADIARYNAPWPLWVLRILPLVLFMPGVARDNTRTLIWLCFVILFYFVSAVEAVFARPTDPITVTGVVSIVVLFSLSVAYIRMRGRELRRGVTVDDTSN